MRRRIGVTVSAFFGYGLVGILLTGCGGLAPTTLHRTIESGAADSNSPEVKKDLIDASGPGQIRVSANSTRVRYRPPKSGTFLPWFLTLSSSGERIQLVRDLNQQVLDTDEIFLDTLMELREIGEASQELIEAESEGVFQNWDELIELMIPLDAVVWEVPNKKARDYLEGATKRRLLDVLSRLVSFDYSTKNNEIQARINANTITVDGNPATSSTLDGVKKELIEAVANELSLKPDLSEGNSNIESMPLSPGLVVAQALEKKTSSVEQSAQLFAARAEGQMKDVGQRFTVFNLRPAAMAAAERNPVGYSITERKFLDSLDLQQAAIVAGAVVEPLIVAFGVIDSIAKRVIKKDGDTELTYFSSPVPFDFKQNGRFANDNRVQIVASNNGKYEFHLNANNVYSAQDGAIDWDAVNKPTSVLGQAVQSDNEVYKAAVEANRDIAIAKTMADTMKNNTGVGAPPVLKIVKSDGGEKKLKAEPSSPVPSDFSFCWMVEGQTIKNGETVPVPFSVSGGKNDTITVKDSALYGLEEAVVSVQVVSFSIVSTVETQAILGKPIPKATFVAELDATSGLISVSANAESLDSVDVQYSIVDWRVLGYKDESSEGEAVTYSESDQANKITVAKIASDRFTRLKVFCRVKTNGQMGEPSESEFIVIPQTTTVDDTTVDDTTVDDTTVDDTTVDDTTVDGTTVDDTTVDGTTVDDTTVDDTTVDDTTVNDTTVNGNAGNSGENPSVPNPEITLAFNPTVDAPTEIWITASAPPEGYLYEWAPVKGYDASSFQVTAPFDGSVEGDFGETFIIPLTAHSVEAEYFSVILRCLAPDNETSGGPWGFQVPRSAPEEIAKETGGAI